MTKLYFFAICGLFLWACGGKPAEQGTNNNGSANAAPAYKTGYANKQKPTLYATDTMRYDDAGALVYADSFEMFNTLGISAWGDGYLVVGAHIFAAVTNPDDRLSPQDGEYARYDGVAEALFVAKSGKVEKTLKLEGQVARAISLTKNTFLVYDSGSRKYVIYDDSGKKIREAATGNENTVLELQRIDDSKFAVCTGSLGGDAFIEIWSDQLQKLSSTPIDKKLVMMPGFAANSKEIAYAGWGTEGTSVIGLDLSGKEIWRHETGKQTAAGENIHLQAGCLAYTADGSLAIVYNTQKPETRSATWVVLLGADRKVSKQQTHLLRDKNVGLDLIAGAIKATPDGGFIVYGTQYPQAGFDTGLAAAKLDKDLNYTGGTILKSSGNQEPYLLQVHPRNELAFFENGLFVFE